MHAHCWFQWKKIMQSVEWCSLGNNLFSARALTNRNFLPEYLKKNREIDRERERKVTLLLRKMNFHFSNYQLFKL